MQLSLIPLSFLVKPSSLLPHVSTWFSETSRLGYLRGSLGNCVFLAATDFKGKRSFELSANRHGLQSQSIQTQSSGKGRCGVQSTSASVKDHILCINYCTEIH
jgi:hypothetical protein